MEQKDSTAPDLPPGYWGCAGRFEGEFGVFLGEGDEVRDFILAIHIPELIAVYMRHGKTSLAAKLEGLRGNVEALQLGRGKVVLDLRAAPAGDEGGKPDAG